jgi:hypothetical protein
VIDAQEAQELRDYHERTAAEDTNAVGSLADKLRGALQGRKPDR